MTKFMSESQMNLQSSQAEECTTVFPNRAAANRNVLVDCFTLLQGFFSSVHPFNFKLLYIYGNPAKLFLHTQFWHYTQNLQIIAESLFWSDVRTRPAWRAYI